MNGGAASWPALKSLAIVILLLCTGILDCKTLAKSAPQALVFGGNGLLGASTVEKLLVGGFHVTIINRGNWYWDSGIKIKPRVHHVTCDRLLSLKSCKEITALSKSKFEVAVDFSGYHRFQIQEVFDIWQDRIGLYIYISSDSVFEVCTKATMDTPEKPMPLDQTMFLYGKSMQRKIAMVIENCFAKRNYSSRI